MRMKVREIKHYVESCIDGISPCLLYVIVKIFSCKDLWLFGNSCKVFVFFIGCSVTL